jgi:hypothetical protein
VLLRRRDVLDLDRVELSSTKLTAGLPSKRSDQTGIVPFRERPPGEAPAVVLMSCPPSLRPSARATTSAPVG